MSKRRLEKNLLKEEDYNTSVVMRKKRKPCPTNVNASNQVVIGSFKPLSRGFNDCNPDKQEKRVNLMGIHRVQMCVPLSLQAKSIHTALRCIIHEHGPWLVKVI